MTSPRSSLEVDVEIEEWAIRYRHELEDATSNAELGGKPDDGAIVSKALIARAGRLGALLRPLPPRKESSNSSDSGSSIRAALFHQTRNEMTNDAVQKRADRWLCETIMVSSKDETLNIATTPCRGRPSAGRRGGCCASPRQTPAGPRSSCCGWHPWCGTGGGQKCGTPS